MRVYQINVTGRFSTGTIARNICDELSARGHSSRFAFGHGGQPDKDSFELCGVWHLRFDAKMQFLTGKCGALSFFTTQKLVNDIKRFDPDVIHLHNLHGNYINVKKLLRFLVKYKRPVVFTLHDCWAFTGGCYYFTVNDCYKWKEKCEHCDFPNQYIFKKLFPVEKKEFAEKKHLFSSIKELKIVAVSEWLREMVSLSFFGERDVVAIHNGIDTSVFRKKDVSVDAVLPKASGKKIVLGVASTWSERKGLSKWKDIAGALSDDYIIILVGLSGEQSLNLPVNIIPLHRAGKTEELVDLYNIANVYVNLSLEETFGLPTVEAMACGTPVIVLDSTANPELVDDKVGIVIDHYSIEKIVGAIYDLADKKERMGADCVKKAKERYSVDIMKAKYVDLYEQLIED